MAKRLKRTPELELSLNIQSDTFIRPPREAQRNALLNRAMKEFVEDLEALDKLATGFVAGAGEASFSDRTQATLTDDQIMEDWQFPVMQAMSEAVAEKGGHILEVGFGRGISSTMIQEVGVDAHTIIECNDSVVDRYHEWKQLLFPENQTINLVHGLWQDTVGTLGQFDGIFFHTYPLNEDEYMKYVNGSITFAGHFFPIAARHLKEGGIFTYFSNEIDSLSRAHQRLLFQHFSHFSAQLLPLEMPTNVQDTWWADSIVIIKAIK